MPTGKKRKLNIVLDANWFVSACISRKSRRTLYYNILKDRRIQIEIGPIPSVVRDADDNYLLGICESCQADFLVMGDHDLLVLGTYQETTIMSMNQFLQMLPVIG